MKKNHWSQPYSSNYTQFKLKKFHHVKNPKLGTIRYCVIPGKDKSKKIPIILIQGMGLEIENWCLDFLKTLDDYTLYVVDPIKSFHMEDYATSIYEITKTLSKFSLLGYSFGSFVIQEYMTMFPTKPVEKIVFIAGGCICNFKLYNVSISGMNTDMYDNELVFKQGISAMKARFSQKNCFLDESKISNIPILIIKAEKEHMFKQDYLFCADNEIIVKNVNHNLLINRPIYIAKQIKSFLL